MIQPNATLKTWEWAYRSGAYWEIPMLDLSICRRSFNHIAARWFEARKTLGGDNIEKEYQTRYLSPIEYMMRGRGSGRDCMDDDDIYDGLAGWIKENLAIPASARSRAVAHLRICNQGNPVWWDSVSRVALCEIRLCRIQAFSWLQ